jgi:hypothetical protein
VLMSIVPPPGRESMTQIILDYRHLSTCKIE